MNGLSGTPRSAKRERKVTVVLRRTNEPVHSSGVESMLLSGDSSSLFTASRDSTIKRWSLNGASGVNPNCTASFEGHTDWVTDLTLVGDLLFSSSNDKTVRVWQSSSPGNQLSILTHHSDYVTKLASAPSRGLLASAGLRGEVYLIDVATGVPQRLRPKPRANEPGSGLQSAPSSSQPASPAARPMPGYGSAAGEPMSSGSARASMGMDSTSQGVVGSPGAAPAKRAGVYSLAMSTSGAVVAAGSSDAIVRLWDTRSGEKICKLRGHNDNVRCLSLNPSGQLLLSGSSDGTLKLWDLYMQRCVQTYVVHSDSVRCMSVTGTGGTVGSSSDADWGVAFSGGRDGRVFRTHLASRTAELLVAQSAPVEAVAFDPQASCLWTSSPSAGSVLAWPVSHEPPTPSARGKGSGGSSFAAPSRIRHLPGTGSAVVSGAPGSGGVRHSVEVPRPHVPAAAAPVRAIPGLPPIVAQRVLTDRRHVLTRDAEGVVELWDVLAGARIMTYGQVEMGAVEASLFEARAVPAWFGADVRLGSLAITLEPPGCFAAESYSQDLGYTNVPDDLKVNFGKVVLDAVFAKWRQRMQSAGSPPHMLHTGGMGADGAPEVYYTEQWPKYWTGIHPAVMCASAAGVPWRRLISGFTGAEAEPEEVPAWVGDVVLRNAVVAPKETKCAFILTPEEGSNLPSLLQSKLNAPRILQVHKVASYCISKLQEAGIQMELWPVYMRRCEGAPEPPMLAPGGPARQFLELRCNALAVPYEMSLAAVKKYIWRKSDDVVFTYSIRDHTSPAPMPAIMHTPC